MSNSAPFRPDQPAQDEVREWFLGLGSDPWLPLLKIARHGRSHVGVLCALAPRSYRSKAVSDPGWDLHGSSGPGFSQSSTRSGRWRTRYHRISSEPVEPLVYEREFHRVLPNYVELSEEFLLFHDLYEERTTGKLLKIDNAGNTNDAGQVAKDDVRVLTALVRQYQAARQMDLLVFIDSILYFDPKLASPKRQEWKAGTMNGVLAGGESMGAPFSRYLATRVLPPPPRRAAGVWPYEPKDKRYPTFVIGQDASGGSIEFTCDPDKLANYFGANRHAPHYLTPVHFRREVLQKYYARPSLYSVEDGYLRCAGLWGVRMDNDGPDRIVVFLGDLGRDLPASERDYWRSYNIPPAGGISATAFRRGFLAQFADADALDLRFRRAYPKLVERWTGRYGWPLFLPPEPGDVHLLNVVRAPLQDTEQEFEELVRTLTKLLIDSLNEAELVRALPPGPKDEKGIGKFERWMRYAAYATVDDDIAFLRNLQTVRSKGAAHRKGSDYERALDHAFGSKRKAAAAEFLLARSLQVVLDLTQFAQASATPPAPSQ